MMPGVDGSDVVAAAAACAAYLGQRTGRDWDLPVPGLDWSVRRTVSHAVGCCLWYAFDLAAGPDEVDALDMRIRPEADPAQTVAAMSAAGGMLARVVDGAPAGARGFHPAGRADASGFAAMACDELLVHTADVAAAWGESFAAEPGLAGRVLHRLFPWAPAEADSDPWAGLLWANGRRSLSGQDDQGAGWLWHCAPLDEWDGTVPRWGPA